jgi:hypothetical protein
MAFNPAWHAEYLALENAHEAAREEYRQARRALDRKRPPAGAQTRHDAALETMRTTGKARWDFEMAATVIVNSADMVAA